MTRPVIVVDTETSGLDPERHLPVEVSWRFLDESDGGTFIPAHRPRDVLASVGDDVSALRINRYIDRIAGQHQDGRITGPMDLLGVGPEAVRLWDAFLSYDGGCTLAGSNPGFDARFLRKLFAHGVDHTDTEPEPWHHRLLDLSNVAQTVLGLPDLPGLARVAELLGLPAPDHTAGGDVDVTVAAFQELYRRRDALLRGVAA